MNLTDPKTEFLSRRMALSWPQENCDELARLVYKKFGFFEFRGVDPMKFDELDVKMRVSETAHDLCVLPGLFMVARLDGRTFTRLTKEVQKFEAPFDERFRDIMVATTEHLMN